MKYNEKKSLYESIMKEVAKTVKRNINEAEVNNFDSVIKDGLDYIQSNEDMNDYYEKANVLDILPTYKVSTMCTDGKTIYYNPKFIYGLTPKETAYIILHQCVHQI
jgi:predicted metal-dependent peptidase